MYIHVSVTLKVHAALSRGAQCGIYNFTGLFRIALQGPTSTVELN